MYFLSFWCTSVCCAEIHEISMSLSFFFCLFGIFFNTGYIIWEGKNELIGYFFIYISQTDLEDYLVTKQVGKGTYGNVFKAQDKYNNLYAIKIFTRDVFNKEKNIQQLLSFKNEMAILSSMKHVNIIKIKSFIVTKQILALVTSYYETTLFQCLKDNVYFEENELKRIIP